MEHKSKVGLIIGRRGSGKTTLAKKIIKASQQKVLIVDTIAHPDYKEYQIIDERFFRHWLRGIKRFIISDISDLESENVLPYLQNCLILFEDSTKYIRYKVSDETRRLIIDTKQKDVSMIFMYHGFGMVQPDMYRLSDYLTMFKTNENIREYKRKIPNFPTVEKAYIAVEKSSNPYTFKTIAIN